jgi:hypothetical protein
MLCAGDGADASQILNAPHSSRGGVGPFGAWSLGAGGRDMDFAAPVLALPLGRRTLSEIFAAFSLLNEPLVTERNLQHRLFARVKCVLRDGAHLGGPTAPLLCIAPCG